MFLQIDGVIGLCHSPRIVHAIPDHELSGWHCPVILQARYSREADRGTAQSIPDQKATAVVLETYAAHTVQWMDHSQSAVPRTRLTTQCLNAEPCEGKDDGAARSLRRAGA